MKNLFAEQWFSLNETGGMMREGEVREDGGT